VFAHAGADVVISDLNGDGAMQVAADIARSSGRACHRRQDGRHPGGRPQATGRQDHSLVRKNHDPGQQRRLGEYTPLWDISSEYMMKSYMLNCVSVYALTKMFVPYLEKEENASVVMSNSMVGTTPSPEFLSYSNAKSAC
jgi:7-alpha-hydroxysteroid dehydrogenase